MRNRTLVGGIIFALCFSLSIGSSLASRIQTTPISELSPLSYSVTQLGGTETPYDNLYWDNHAVGIYVDIIDGTPLFSSLDKYDSDTGWPTFARPINRNNILKQDDTTGGILRDEIRSRRSGSHLGHLFDDGPARYNGVRYCMNSAALRFVPLAKMRSEGYVSYMRLFRK
jgi:methionine-R-sulfoxide reductase